jgi:hypothetical protein
MMMGMMDGGIRIPIPRNFPMTHTVMTRNFPMTVMTGTRLRTVMTGTRLLLDVAVSVDLNLAELRQYSVGIPIVACSRCRYRLEIFQKE